MLTADMFQQKQVGKTETAAVRTRVRLMLVGAYRLSAKVQICDKQAK